MSQATASASGSPIRRVPSRSASQRKSYVDLTRGSSDEGEDEEVVQPKSDNKRKRVAITPVEAESEAGDGEEDDEEYEIDYIVDARNRRFRGQDNLEFFIHWKGYSKKDRSWTDATQFETDDPPVVEFYTENPSKAGAAHFGFASKPETSKSKVQAKAKNTVASDDEVEIDNTPRTKKATAPSSPTAPTKTPRSTMPVLPDSSGRKLNGGDLRGFFSRTPATGKENKDTSAGSPVSKKAAPVKPKASAKPAPKAAPPKKKRKSDSDDESDFVLEEEAAVVESEADSDGDASAADEGSEASAEEDVVSEEEKKPKKNSGWNKSAGAKVVKKPKVNLNGYKTGIKSLPGTENIKTAIKNVSENLPPLHDVELMFDHLVSRVSGITKLVDRLNGRKLRLATMCSGTESPLLALNMIAKAIKEQHGMTLGFEHVFSCEIEPFKQAYIERNFAPPILFRDVTELGKKKAHTAYGSLVEVPGNVDVLIAGTSCVDYSNLNNKQQDIEANGESGRTFRGMLQWVKKNQPPIVILENVCSAPWDKVVEYFAQIDYDASFLRLDTKEFYIPHTRTRVYLFATPQKASSVSDLAAKWEATVQDMKRPWSSPFEALMLSHDDPNIHRARLDLASAKDLKDGPSRKPTDWNRCESRHQRARQEEQLGLLRPLTAWQEAGVCKGLDWTWNDWLQAQTERVVDLLDISTLRMAKEGIDAGFKACIWNVSQNVDRQAGSGRTALSPCLTPNMIAWVTNRGGPITGREALALQGIPVRELLLTSENEDQLADLAGNAMTTTVVGSCVLAGLMVALDRLPQGQGEAVVEEVDDEVATRITGEDALERHELDLAKVATADLAEIMDLAERSSRHCQCEGQSGTASSINKCTACSYRSCKSCGGRPDHQYVSCTDERVEPSDFERRFKDLLPMRVKVAGVTADTNASLRTKAEEGGKGKVDEKDWALWSKAVLEGVTDAEFRFRYLKRQFTWTAVYEAPHARLDLVLQNKLPEWRLTIKTPIDEAVNSRLRALLLHPVARMRFDISGQDVLCGPWELCIPTKQAFKVDIKGTGELVPSWHASLGLLAEHEGKQRWSELEVTVPADQAACLDRNVSGKYTLLPKCGQAMSSLHVKERDEQDEGLPDLFFFLDPTRCGEADDDVYVFSTSTERLEYGTERATIATLESKWRESSRSSESVKMDVRGGWVKCDAAHLTAVGGSNIVVESADTGAKRDTATYAVSTSTLQVTDTCKHAAALLSCSVPLDPAHSEAMWKKGEWGEIDIPHQGNTTFANLAWITERLPALDAFTSWTAIEGSKEACDRCAPKRPRIHWIKRAGKLNKNGGKTKATIVAFEDKLEAGRYEHALKHRPAPFAVQLRLDKDIGSFRIGLNIVSLAHRAASRLPARAATLSWRLTPGQVADVPQPPRVFLMPSNKRDPQHAQPEGFVLPLRKEQLRSLWWMLEQERATDPTFVEEEISEAALPALGWRAEGKAERPVLVRGGVIADQVGYGKTIISLALIAESKEKAAPEPAPKGLIDLKATLIVVPGHLSKQWPSEIDRFTGNMFRVIVIQNMKDLNSRSIAELSKADIIVMASEIFEADGYWSRFEYLSAQSEEWLSDKMGGRFFCDRLDAAIGSLRDQTSRLDSEGSQAVLDHMDDRQRKATEDAKAQREAQKTAQYGKRQKGQAYRDRYDAIDGKKAKKATVEEVQKWEASEDEEEEEVAALPVPTYRKASGTDSFGSSSVKKDSRLLTAPVMHMFRFRRVIADEFTYLEKKSLAALLRLESCYKWVLSGTPPVSDFPAIRSIAAFLGIHLGVEDDAEGTAQHQKSRAKEQTDAEKFHAFREVHSAAWHRRRDDLAQEFLNTFVRQNLAEIDDIPTVEHVHHIKLPASEGAVYLELEHHLQALEMQARKETKFKNVTQGDRNARLEEALADSKTAEEALLKRCCHFTLDLTDTKREAKSAHEACEHISYARSSQLKGCEDDLYRSINTAVGLHLYIRKKGFFGKSDEDRQHFKEFVDFSFDRTKHQGDREAAERLIAVLQRCGFAEDGTFPTSTIDGKTAKVASDAKVEDVKWELREQSHLLRRLSKELVARVRSLRFFEVVRKLQKNGEEAKKVIEESGCSHKPSTHPTVEMAVLSCCGHIACVGCMTLAADSQACIQGAECSAAVRHTNIVKVSSLGIEGELSSGRYGAKLQKMVDLIQSIPKRERVLVFLQWEDLAKKVSEALTAGGIPHETLSGSVKSRANTLDKFQKGDSDSARVLLLKMNDASAAGSNLTTANHAIFLGPLFTPSLLNYRAVETQAIGRVRRYGQQRKVHIHRLLALDTIDTAIFEGRDAELRAKADYAEIPREEYDGKSSKRASVEDEDRPAKKARRDQEEPIEID